jgi:hypothetical protein
MNSEKKIVSKKLPENKKLIILPSSSDDEQETEKDNTVYDNKFLLKKELLEYNYLKENPDSYDYLYPTLNDPEFNIKIAEKKEFNDTQYDGSIDKDLTIEQQAEIISKAEFEIAPHQTFVKNFLSFQTPYNSLLLYHGLGSGKTFSSIGVCEEMRDYLKQMGINKRIIVVASPNVQDNFRLQLFDERKLKLVDGLWTIQGGIGNKLLKEINPMNTKGLTRENVISQIKSLINSSYIFLGYDGFANYIRQSETGIKKERMSREDKDKKIRLPNVFEKLDDRIKRNLNNEFNSRLIVIDEIHNIRITEDNENKKVAQYLMRLVESAENMRLLFMSATPMYNNYKEIIYLLNLMNVNDRRAKIEVGDVFDKNGNFVEGGEELLVRKASGYVSFVRGENPFTFPYKVYPEIFDYDNSIKKIKYPDYQMNGKKIKEEDKLKRIDVYLTQIGEYQNLGYKYIIDQLKEKQITITTKKGIVRNMPAFEDMESFGYTLLQTPLEALNIVYPVDNLEEYINNSSINSDSEILSLRESEPEEESPEPKSEEIVEEEQPEPKSEEIVEEGSPEPKSEEIEKSQSNVNEKIVLTDKKSSEKSLTSLNDNSSITSPSPINVKLSSMSNDDNNIIELTNKKSSERSITSYGGYQSNGGDKSDDIKYKIDPRILTGTKGLERIMDFVDSKSPPEKGSFEYREKYSSKDKHIFSPNQIGKYSSKIKNICNSIFSPDGNICEGIVLIYSQFIDGGLIPMALALEEMGFMRYGDNAKSLFKKPPTEIVDVRTMRPKDKDKKSDFMPAKYAMITGDPRLSPNNNFEIKGLTGEDNKDGYKVKVVLISLAGSEGIDLKCIRQVHIMDPWYNMNRIEQIVGRAVRNFSHKELPFEKRNVEIFLYGTVLENNNKETVDLYLYRMAENKAIQIGKVSRILKEISVDCILNYQQLNFTQEKFKELIANSNNKTVKQKLSNGKVIKNFKIGDAPNTASCDYMETCEYKCRPYNKDINEDDIKEDTYNEKFIMMNSEKIIQKIKNLFSDKINGKFFYKKNDLLREINIIKRYPIVQIYAALTQLIEDKSEYILDKYGRTGYLVNIGDYYLFQPSELNNKNISIFERSVPIDYKNNMVQFELKEDILKQSEKETLLEIREDNITKVKTIDIDVKNKMNAKNIIDNIHNNFELSKKYYTEKIIIKGTEENSWYKNCGSVMRHIIKTFPNIQEDILFEFLVNHIIDMLDYNDKVILLDFIQNISYDQSYIEKHIVNYFDKKIIKYKRHTAIILFDINKKNILLLNSNSKTWKEAEPEDEIEINDYLNLKGIPNNFNDIIGFITSKSNKNDIVFKTKNMKEKRDTGASCESAGKKKQLTLLNTILKDGEKNDNIIYDNENTKDIKGGLCCFIEFMMRYYDYVKRNNKIWYLDPDTTKLYNF